MKFYDISMPITPDMMVWENNEGSKPKFDRNVEKHVTSTTMTLNLHTGTHIDAPLHMINDADTFETINLDRLVRKVKVIDLTNAKDGITRSDLEDCSIEKGDFLLCRTTNSFHTTNQFDFDFIYLKEDAADFCIEKQIDGIAIDTLGIERSQEGNPTHRKLFRNDIIVCAFLAAGEYFMVASPLHLIGTEAGARSFI